jgi:hypothetical protein
LFTLITDKKRFIEAFPRFFEGYMTTFDERQKAFERKYALDEEMAFKINARRNKLLGLWAAEKMGVSGTEAENYAKSVVAADFEEAGDQDVIKKLLHDFSAASFPITEKEIRHQMERCAHDARLQITGKAE